MSTKKIKRAQLALKYFDFYNGDLDGIMGRETRNAIRKFQIMNGLKVTASLDRDTLDELFPEKIEGGLLNRPLSFPLETEDQLAIKMFYGTVNSIERHLSTVKLPYPMKLAWGNHSIIEEFQAHELVAKRFEAIFTQTLAVYGIENIRELGLDIFGGCFNKRPMRGSSNTLSLHSWAIALDLNPAENRLKWRSPKARFSSSEYNIFWNIVEENGATSKGRCRNFDWMHFQFANI